MGTDKLFKDDPRCKRCGRRPHEITEYVAIAEKEGMSPATFVVLNEGTYNDQTERFYCTECYITLGCPTGTA